MAKNNEVQLVSEGLENKLKSNLKNTPKAPKEPKEDPIVIVDEKEDEVVVVLEKPEEVVAPVKMVKVLMKENHKCCIGNEWYYLMKDKQYNVPSNVKDVLMRADKLSPL